MNDQNTLPRIFGEERDLVEDLLRLADSGPEIPVDGADLIKAAIKPLWRRELRARAMRRWMAAAAGVAAAGLLAIAVANLYQSSPAVDLPIGPVAFFEVVNGRVEIDAAGGGTTVLSELDPSVSVLAGSRIRTGGNSRASLRLGENQSLRLDVDTTIRVSSATRIELEQGTAYLDSRGAAGPPVDVATPFGVVRDIGTQFEVKLTQGPLSVAVREGVVAVIRDDVDLEIGSGALVTVDAAGRIDRRALAPDAPHWAWVQEVAPPFDIEGRSVADFLGWVSRETGSPIRYSEPELEDFASETVLYGSMAGLSPTEAPEVVLASCGLVVRRDAESLVVRRPQSGSREP
jgi:ferric-dicitrate binding protein FerR (iron transport regulator)